MEAMAPLGLIAVDHGVFTSRWLFWRGIPAGLVVATVLLETSEKAPLCASGRMYPNCTKM